MRIGIDNLKSEKTNVTMMYGFKKDVIVLSGKAFKHFVLTHNSSFKEKSNRRRNSMNYLKPRQKSKKCVSLFLSAAANTLSIMLSIKQKKDKWTEEDSKNLPVSV